MLSSVSTIPTADELSPAQNCSCHQLHSRMHQSTIYISAGYTYTNCMPTVVQTMPLNALQELKDPLFDRIVPVTHAYAFDKGILLDNVSQLSLGPRARYLHSAVALIVPCAGT